MVSHAVSHRVFTTGISNDLKLRRFTKLHTIAAKISCDIFSFVHVLQYVSRGTCTQCVPVVLIANRDQFFDRSDRASNTSFVCWQSNVRFYPWKKKSFFLQFPNLLSLFVSQEVPSTDSLPQVISKQLQSEEFKEFVPSPYNVLLKTNSISSARGWRSRTVFCFWRVAGWRDANLVTPSIIPIRGWGG